MFCVVTRRSFSKLSVAPTHKYLLPPLPWAALWLPLYPGWWDWLTPPACCPSCCIFHSPSQLRTGSSVLHHLPLPPERTLPEGRDFCFSCPDLSESCCFSLGRAFSEPSPCSAFACLYHPQAQDRGDFCRLVSAADWLPLSLESLLWLIISKLPI